MIARRPPRPCAAIPAAVDARRQRGHRGRLRENQKRRPGAENSSTPEFEAPAEPLEAVFRTIGLDLDDMGPPAAGSYYLVVEVPLIDGDVLVLEAARTGRIGLVTASAADRAIGEPDDDPGAPITTTDHDEHDCRAWVLTRKLAEQIEADPARPIDWPFSQTSAAVSLLAGMLREFAETEAPSDPSSPQEVGCYTCGLLGSPVEGEHEHTFDDLERAELLERDVRPRRSRALFQLVEHAKAAATEATAALRFLRVVPARCGALDMIHAKVVDGELVPSGGPSCWQCSKAILADGRIGGVWLFHNEGWRRYGATEFHRLTLKTCELKGGPGNA